MKLTPKQEAFVNKYMECGNASEAYRFAYDVGEDRSGKSISVDVNELLKHPSVSLVIKNLQAELKLKHEVTRSRMVDECFDIINKHKKLRSAFDGKTISASDMKKVYAMANSGFINGGNVMTAISQIVKMMGLDKEDEKQATAQTINNIQINIKRDR